jgi:hypothetical protein
MNVIVQGVSEPDITIAGITQFDVDVELVAVSIPDITIAGMTQFDIDVELVAPSTIVVSQVGTQGPPGDSFFEINPVFSYTNGNLTRIDYESGNYKTFAYSNGALSVLTYYTSEKVITKTFAYTNGALTSIVQTEVIL